MRLKKKIGSMGRFNNVRIGKRSACLESEEESSDEEEQESAGGEVLVKVDEREPQAVALVILNGEESLEHVEKMCRKAT